MVISVRLTGINIFQLIKISSLKSFFIYLWKALSSDFWIPKNFKKNSRHLKNFLHFCPKFLILLFKFVGKNIGHTHFNFFFIEAFIFSNRSLKNHKIFVWHFLLTFLWIFRKNFANQVQNFQLMVFLILHKNQEERGMSEVK
jgi:hypothetical protein